jgi:hypothetical protein
MDRELAISWLLYAVRATLGLSNVRNAILRNGIKNAELGPTFSSGNTVDDVLICINKFQTSEKRFLIFTANGEIKKSRKRQRLTESYEVESHYISFILDSVHKRAIIIDPSRNRGKPGIYNPYAGIILEPYIKEYGYTTRWLEMSTPCQEIEEDVFCQSWTLFLVCEAFVCDKIMIPKNQHFKYHILLRFFKELLQVPQFSKELKISYTESINDHVAKRKLSMFDPCELLLSMNAVEME